MNDELKDILSNLDKDIDQEKLLQYLNRSMPAAEEHAFEKQMNDDEFMNDAVEGLQQLNNKNDLPLYIEQLNADLKKQLDKKKHRKDKRKLPSLYWTYISIILLLILAVIAYIVIRKMP